VTSSLTTLVIRQQNRKIKQTTKIDQLAIDNCLTNKWQTV